MADDLEGTSATKTKATKLIISKEGRLPHAKVRRGVVEPFSNPEQDVLKSVARREQALANCVFPDNLRAMILQAPHTSLVTVADLFHEIRKAGGGAICWNLATADSELVIQIIRLAWPRHRKMPPMYSGISAISNANTVLFSDGYDVICGLYSTTSFDFRALCLFLRGVFRLNSLEPMPDAEDQIALLGRPFEDAKALINQHAGQRSAELRDAAAIAIAFALNECQAGRTEKLHHIVQMAKGELTASGKRKKKKRDLPALPSGYNWPTEKFIDSPEFGRNGGIVLFLERVWKPLIAANLVTRPLLKLADNRAGKALDAFFYNQGRERRTLPPELYIPSKFVRAPSQRKKVPQKPSI